MEALKKSWENTVIFVKDHKLIVIIGSIFILLLIILAFILLTTAPPTTVSTDPNSNTTTTTTGTGTTTQGTAFGSDGADSGSTTGDSTGIDTAGTDVTIEVWGAFLSEDDLSNVIADFESENNGVTIKYNAEVISNDEISSYQSRLEDILSDGDTAPDLFIVDSGWSGMFAQYAAPAPSSVITSNQVGSDYYSFVETDFVINDEVLGLPTMVDTLAIIYNKDLWASAGLGEPSSDWSTLVDEQLSAITESFAGDTTKAAMSVGPTAEFNYELLSTLFMQNGITPINADGEVEITSDDSTAQSVVSFYQELETAGGWTSDFKLDVAEFLEGNLATYVAPSWRLNDIERYSLLAGINLDYGVAELPQVSSNEAEFAVQPSYWGYMVNANSANIETSWEFLRYLSSSQSLTVLGQTIASDDNDILPSLFAIESTNSSNRSDDQVAVYISTLAYSKSWQTYNELEVRDLFDDLAAGSGSLSSIESGLESLVSENQQE